MSDYENIIPSGFSKCVSYLIKNNRSSIYFSLGVGDSTWDDEDLPIPSVTIDSLTNEVFRKRIVPSNIEYVDPTTLEVSSTPTSMLRIEIQITSNDYYGVVREYGIFAINASSTLDTGTLISYCRHKKLIITTDATYHKYIYFNT